MAWGIDRSGKRVWVPDDPGTTGQYNEQTGEYVPASGSGQNKPETPNVGLSIGGGGRAGYSTFGGFGGWLSPNPVASGGLQDPSPGGSPGNVTKLPPAHKKPSPFDMSQPGGGETTGFKAADQLMSGPGATEQQWGATQGQWNSPTAVEGYWQGVQGKYNGGGPMVSNRADDAYSSYMRAMPTINPEANMGSYYDNARTRFGQETDRALGARGAFNSSAALDKIGQGMATLNAQQAKDEAQYGLDRASTLGNLWSIGGTMARGADTSSLAQAESQRSWVDTLGGLAGQASRSELDRLAGGIGAASKSDSARVDRVTAAVTAALGAQGAHDKRVQGAVDNIMGLGDKVAGVAADAYQAIIDGDMAAMSAALSGDAAYFQEKFSMSVSESNQFVDAISAATTAAPDVKKALE